MPGETIAVLGIGCRFPGGITSPAEFWEALLNGRDVISDVPPDRWDADLLYDPEPRLPGMSVTRRGGFIEDVDGFDAAFFRISSREAEAMDPQHRVLLETAWEALEHAGIPPSSLARTSVGVFIGTGSQDYYSTRARTSTLHHEYSALGSTRSMASGRISYLLDVHGPSANVDTACSSSLVAVDLASQALISGRCDLALAGGVHLLFDPDGVVAFSRWGMLSPDGQCRAFDADARGFVRSEGCGVVVLRRLSDAVRAGDRVLAVIRASGVNQDGRTHGITVPSRNAQEALNREVIGRAGIDPARVGLVEAHGTGTPTGDPIEFAALSAVYGAGTAPAALGSVKSTIGHCESAAGVAGLIKAVLAVHQGVIPANLHFDRWNPDIDPLTSRFFVPTTVTDWPAIDGPRVATVSSYGISGINAHLVLEQAPASVADDAAAPRGGEQVYPVSASSLPALARTAQRLADWLRSEAGHQVSVADVGATLAIHRAARPVRAAVVARDRNELLEGLLSLAQDKKSARVVVECPSLTDAGPVWLFSGQGSQWEGMAAGLLREEEAFAEVVAELEPVIAAESGFSLHEVLSCADLVTGFARVQPALFAIQVGLAAAWRARGMTPAAVIGHSVGEVAAAVVAGGLSMVDGARVVCRRSRLGTQVAGRGAMGAVVLSAEQVAAELAARGIDDVVVAVEASPHSTVVAGDANRVRRLLADWENRDLPAREIAVDVASHSPQIDPIIEQMREELSELSAREPVLPFYSTVWPGLTPRFDRSYWVDNMRLPVRFAGAVEAALADGHRLFVELSPHPLLLKAVDEVAAASGADVRTVPSRRRGVETSSGLAPALAAAHCAGAAIDWTVDHGGGRLADLPLPAWERVSLMLPRRSDREQSHDGPAGHPLLGAHARRATPDGRYYWQGEFGTSRLPWLADHKVLGYPVLPATALVEMALAAAAEVYGADAAVEVEDIVVHDALPINERVTVFTEGVECGPDRTTIRVASRDADDDVVRHADMRLHRTGQNDGPPARCAVPAVGPHPSKPAEFYVRQRDRGVDYGPMFQAIAGYETSDREPGRIVATVTLPTALRATADAFRLHPVLLDACLQLTYAHRWLNDPPMLYVPARIGRVRVLGAPARGRYAVVDAKETAGVTARFDVRLLASDGAVLVEVLDFEVRAGTTGKNHDVPGERLLALDWEQTDAVPAGDGTDRSVLVLTEEDPSFLTRAVVATLVERTSHTALCRVPLDADDGVAQTTLREQLADGTVTDLVFTCPPHAQTAEPDLTAARARVTRLVRTVQTLTNSTTPPRLLLITFAAQHVRADDNVNLDQSALRGLIHVIGNEHPELRAAHLDLDADGQVAGVVANEILNAPATHTEVAYRQGRRYVAKLRTSTFGEADHFRVTPDPRTDAVALRIKRYGDLDSLSWTLRPRRAPDAHQIEVEVHATALNFHDIHVVMGRGNPLGREDEHGLDYAGVVRAVGSAVTRFRPGDRVAGFWPGSFSSYCTVPAASAVRLPDTMPFHQAAALPTAVLTATYALRHLAHARSGERVLVHSATGGFGTAATALARSLGAELFCTAGTPAKRRLLRAQGIEHVFNSRDVDFADRIRDLTDGQGVDIVLNTVTGPGMRAGLELLRPFGRFIELGLRDVYADRHLDLLPFHRNITFTAVDMALLASTQPALLATLTSQLEQDLDAGRTVTMPVSRFPRTEVIQAFRTMHTASHVGKLVIDITDPPHATHPAYTVAVQPQDMTVVRPDSAYLITGGLGGIGLHMATWLADNSAERIVLNARSRFDDRAQQVVERLRARGCDIRTVHGDLAEPATAQRLVDECLQNNLRLGGVVYAAMVLTDAAVTNITEELIHRAWRPKAEGAWRLHLATAHRPPAWWLSFSSLTALVGNPGQGTYVAANSWLEAFTHWRRRQGLRTQHVSWGIWAGHGHALRLADRGYSLIEPAEGIAICDRILRHDRPAIGYGPLTRDDWLASLGDRALSSVLLSPLVSNPRSDSETTTPGQTLATLTHADTETRRRLLVDRVVEHVAACLALDPTTIGIEQPFADRGLDSLLALEMRNRIAKELQIRLTPKDLRTYGTPALLGARLAELLGIEIS